MIDKIDPNERQAPTIFSPRRRRLARARSAVVFDDHDFLHRRAMEDIVDRLETVTRSFPDALLIGVGSLSELLTPECSVGDIVQMDPARARLPHNGVRVVGDEENLPFAPQSFDLVVSLLTLHGANDFLGALIQARQSLKPDGLFLAAVFGDGTLQNWRTALRDAEVAASGSLAQRNAPLAAIQDYGQALSRAGYAMPVIDADNVDVTYANPQGLIRDLRGIGETGGLAAPPASLTRATAAGAFARFAENGGIEQFSIVYLTGWAPHASQPKPRKRGSATASMESEIRKF